MTQPVFLSAKQVVERYAGTLSLAQLYELARLGEIPNRKLPGRRGLLFPVVDLERYEAGEVELEVVKLPRGGRICRPRKR